MSGDNARIEDLAGAILDGAPIDWASAASSADVDAALLKELRVLAAIAAHRRKEISPAPDEAGYSPASASADRHLHPIANHCAPKPSRLGGAIRSIVQQPAAQLYRVQSLHFPARSPTHVSDGAPSR